jgi:AcrR family transcriptional regulator
MGSRERRERERADTRNRILDAAREMFVNAGYEATTMRSIADRIEYTPTAIYHHFENKEALLGELCAEDFRGLARMFQRIGRVTDPVDRLHRIGEVYVDFGLRNPMHYRFMFMTPRPPVTGETRDMMRNDPSEDAYAFLRQTCADAIAGGHIREQYQDADQLAQMLWAGCHGIVSLHIAKGHDDWVDWRDVRHTATEIRQAMMRGVLREV